MPLAIVELYFWKLLMINKFFALYKIVQWIICFSVHAKCPLIGVVGELLAISVRVIMLIKYLSEIPGWVIIVQHLYGFLCFHVNRYDYFLTCLRLCQFAFEQFPGCATCKVEGFFAVEVQPGNLPKCIKSQQIAKKKKRSAAFCGKAPIEYFGSISESKMLYPNETRETQVGVMTQLLC